MADATHGAWPVDVGELSTIESFRHALALIETVWGGDAGMDVSLLRAISSAGGYVAGAYRKDRLVGASIGFLGQDHAGAAWGEPTLHSHVTGVLVPGRGVGMALKRHQRDWCHQRGIAAITWTYDPLVARNTWFNVGKLGADVISYHVDHYGLLDDVRNAGQPSDRLLVRWPASLRGDPSAAARVDVPDRELVVRARAWLRADQDGHPLVEELDVDGGATLLSVAVPPDIERLRAEEPELALAWRMAVRETLGEGLASGLTVRGSLRDGTYVLEPRQEPR